MTVVKLKSTKCFDPKVVMDNVDVKLLKLFTASGNKHCVRPLDAKTSLFEMEFTVPGELIDRKFSIIYQNY